MYIYIYIGSTYLNLSPVEVSQYFTMLVFTALRFGCKWENILFESLNLCSKKAISVESEDLNKTIRERKLDPKL
jgi:hypothetical protein